MKKRTFGVKYKNGAIMQVIVQAPPKNWRSEEPNDVIRVVLRNKQYLGREAMEWIMRPDEAQTLIGLLSEAIHHWMWERTDVAGD